MKIGQVIVTEGDRKSWISKGIAWKTESWWTHSLIVVDPGTAVEATFPKIRFLDLEQRLEQLRKQDRAYVVLDLPTEYSRYAVARAACGFVGKFYDVGQILVYAATGRFIGDGVGTLVCSRLCAAAFKRGINVDIWDPSKVRDDFARKGDLAANEVTAPDLLYRSKLEIVRFQPSSRIRRVHLWQPA
jgi:hypothetical protein